MKSKDKERITRATKRLLGERHFRPIDNHSIIWVFKDGDEYGILMDSENGDIRRTVWALDLIEFQVKCGNWIEIF